MKIVILHRYPISQVVGTNASFISFLRELDKQGHSVFYLTYKEPKGAPSPRDSLSFVHYCYLPFSFNRGNNRDKSLKTALWLVLAPLYSFFLRVKEKADLFYTDDSVPYYPLLVKLLTGKAKVIMRLGDLQSAYKFADQGRFKAFFYKLSLSLEKLIWQTVDGVVAISLPFKDFLLGQGISPAKIAVVRESVNLDELQPLPAPLGADPVISFHGALLPQKGVPVLLRAFQLFQKDYPQSRLLIAGGGSSEEELKALARKLGIFSQVDFTGWYDHQKLVSLIKDARFAVVMRSPNFANNFVVTTCLLENWALGKAVIVPQLRAFQTVVKERENGLFFAPGDSVDLYRQMKTLWEDDKLRKRLATQGRISAQKIFDKDLIAKEMTKALTRLSSPPPPLSAGMTKKVTPISS